MTVTDEAWKLCTCHGSHVDTIYNTSIFVSIAAYATGHIYILYKIAFKNNEAR